MRLLVLAGATSALLFSGAAFSQQILKNEPPIGGMKTGEVVYVDNGKCAKGQVQKVTGGVINGRMGSGGGGSSRERACVPRP